MIRAINADYAENGVIIIPAFPSTREKVEIIYDGLLVQNGASDVYAHVGFGRKWKKRSDYKMIKTNAGFEVSVPVEIADTLNVCFKDNANHWDNNSGIDYSFDIHS